MLMLQSSVTRSCPSEASAALNRARAPPASTTPTAAKARRSWSTPPRTQSASPRSSGPPEHARRPSGTTRRARSHPPIFFSAPTQPPERPANGGVAHRNPAHPLQKLAPLDKGRRRTFFEVFLLQQPPPGALVELLAPLARRPLGGEVLARVLLCHVAFDGRDADAEGVRATCALGAPHESASTTSLRLRSTE